MTQHVKWFKRLSLPLICVSVVGCSSLPDEWGYWLDEEGEVVTVPQTVMPAEDSGLVYRPDSRDFVHQAQKQRRSTESYRDPLHSGFSPMRTHKLLNDYAEQLAMALMDNANQLQRNDLVGITSFVRLNASLQEPTILGNQMAEYLMTELQDFGLAVVDFKLANSLSVTPYGDLAMSRRGSELARQINLDHIVTGTITEHPRGVNINARMIAVENKRLVASANLFVPAFVVTSLNPSIPSSPTHSDVE